MITEKAGATSVPSEVFLHSPTSQGNLLSLISNPREGEATGNTRKAAVSKTWRDDEGTWGPGHSLLKQEPGWVDCGDR